MPLSSELSTNFPTIRNRMVEEQIACRGVSDPRVLAVMRTVPREIFVSPNLKDAAYADSAVPIAGGQTISQPYIAAAMLEAAELHDGDKALEVGAGSGYLTALMGRLADRVYAIERHPALTEAARERLRCLGYDNVELKSGDGSKGWPEAAPFDVIIVSAAAPKVPQSLKKQLAIGGRLVIPVGTPDEQRLIRLTRMGKTDFQEKSFGAVRFVRLIGAESWKRADEPQQH
jgi:protein-L-isoaspartate(D-aspartate) O-methyltransferase